MLEDHPFDSSLHDRDAFDCGVAALNEYLRQFADQHRRKGITSVYVLAGRFGSPVDDRGLLHAQRGRSRCGATDRRRSQAPAALSGALFSHGRLACRLGRQGEGLGKLLLGCAVDRCIAARRQIAAYALLVDAKDEAAKRFYSRFGFAALRDAELTLYLPLGR